MVNVTICMLTTVLFFCALGNKMGPEAMNAKVEIAKDLFQMLEPDSHGNVRMEQVKYVRVCNQCNNGCFVSCIRLRIIK